MLIKHRPYWPLRPSKVEELKGWTYMGAWAIKDKRGGWTDAPLEVYYDPNPDTAKGHSHYPGLFYRHDGGEGESRLWATDAQSAFSVPLTGIKVDGEVYVSRYRHDFTGRAGSAIDGGRDYTRLRLIGDAETVTVDVDGPMFSVNGEVLEVIVEEPDA